MSIAPTLVLNAIAATLVLALSALGLAIIFGMMGVINLAHGAFIAMGAYIAWLATNAGTFWLGLLAAPLVVGAFGYVLETTLVGRLYDRPLDTILATWGVALAVQEALKLAFGVTTKNVPHPIGGSVTLGGVTYPSYRVFLILVSATLIVAVFLGLARTDTGIRIRAAIQDGDAASLLGLNEVRLYRLTFALGAALAGFAGAAVAPVATVAPDMGVSYLVESFFAVIVGGTLGGVVLGSALVAGLANFLSYLLSPVVASTVVFVAAILVVAIRPEGLRS
ncbi:MAG: branched-chain amino acid ABC transporter permease [Halapricum sp.]